MNRYSGDRSAGIASLEPPEPEPGDPIAMTSLDADPTRPPAWVDKKGVVLVQDALKIFSANATFNAFETYATVLKEIEGKGKEIGGGA